MADEIPSLQIDTDWKKQAQEEKRRLAEKAAQAKAAAPAPMPAAAAAPSAAAEAASPFSSLVQQMLTQSLFYLGEIAYRGAPPMMDLDRAKHQHDLLTMLEEKTVNNLTPEEQTLLDTALHEVRSRFVRAAAEYISI